MTIHVSISPELEQFVSQQVAGGHYFSVDELIQKGLQTLRDKQERLERLRHEINLGLEDSAAGRTEIFDEKVVEELIAKSRARRKAKDSVTT